jgi:hypothetical protein
MKRSSCSATEPGLGLGRQRAADGTAARPDDSGEHYGVLDGLAAASTEVRSHRMRCVAEHGDAAGMHRR